MLKKLLWIIGVALVAAAIVFGLVHYAEAPGILNTTGSSQQNANSNPLIVQTSNAAVGLWRSTDDTKYTLELDANGNATERYDGDSSATATGTWSLFTSDHPDADFHGTATPSVVFAKLTTGGSVRFFAFVDMPTTSMNLVYLDRGNTLSFTKQK